MAEHVKAVCPTNGDCGGMCNFCCLYICSVCGGLEAALPEDCPGRRMTNDEMDAVQAGRLDFVHGRWVGARVARMGTPEEQAIGQRLMEIADSAGFIVTSPDMGYKGFSFAIVQNGTLFRILVNEGDAD
jgi:hypothetical protein